MSQICERPGSVRDSLTRSPIGARKSLLPALIAVFETPMVWVERSEHRQKLRQLNDRTLRDVGLSRADISREARKPFWRA